MNSFRNSYSNVRASFHSMPTILDLRDILGIRPINTGRQHYLFGPAGLVTDDLEGLHAVCDEQGRTRLVSGTEFAMQMYRGQTQEHTPCLPALGRKSNVEEQLLALCRNIAFEDCIADHPFVQLAEKSNFLGYPLYVDREGLGQHYGRPTNMLDVTCNFDVASFFATCAWNNELRQYVPMCDTRLHGVIYRLTPMLLFDPSVPDRPCGPFHIVGWQPLPRPEQQRAFVIRMKPGQDFGAIPSVECFRFRHSARVSNRIWRSFDEGRELFPADAAAELAVRAEALHQFTPHQIERAWERLEQWTEKTFCTEERLAINERSGLVEVSETMLGWGGLDVETDKDRLFEKLRDVLSRVRYRRAMYLG